MSETPQTSEGSVDSSNGMMPQVIRGSIWTVVGNFGPLLVSPLATPFTIRLLGVDGYGAFSLIGILPAYLGFADLGMGMASTKFGSESFREADSRSESSAVWTSALVATFFALPIVLLLLVFSSEVVNAFAIPANILADTTKALQISAVSLFVGFLNSIFNTPQLSRLRMDLNAAITSLPRMLSVASIPVVLYYGGGLTGAASVVLTANLLTLAGHLHSSHSLLPELRSIRIDLSLVRPLLLFGSGMALTSIAAVLLTHMEKVILAVTVSVQSLAFYAVAANLAGLLTIVSSAMSQSLIPAFVRLQRDELLPEREVMFQRATKIALLTFLPMMATLLSVAGPLLRLWAGEEIGLRGVAPLYVIVAGLMFNLMAFVPLASLMAEGKTHLLAKLYWIELVPYSIMVWYLSSHYAELGAAAAWTVRVIADASLLFYLNFKSTGLKPTLPAPKGFLLGAAVLAVPILLTTMKDLSSWWTLFALVASLVLYGFIVVFALLTESERFWVRGIFKGGSKKPQ